VGTWVWVKNDWNSKMDGLQRLQAFKKFKIKRNIFKHDNAFCRFNPSKQPLIAEPVVTPSWQWTLFLFSPTCLATPRLVWRTSTNRIWTPTSDVNTGERRCVEIYSDELLCPDWFRQLAQMYFSGDNNMKPLLTDEMSELFEGFWPILNLYRYPLLYYPLYCQATRLIPKVVSCMWG